MLRFLNLLLVLMITGGIAAADDPSRVVKEKKALQGLWQAIRLEANGQVAPAKATQAFQVEFKGDRIAFNPASEARKHKFAIDPLATPKTMDLTLGDGPKKGQKLPCAIYKLESDKLTICLDKEGEVGSRPTQFKTVFGDGFAMIVLKKLKIKK